MTSEENTGISILKLLRPDKLNALNDDFFVELQDIMYKIKSDDAVKVLVIIGDGKGFCAGADLNASILDADTKTATKLLNDYCDNIILNMRKMKKIVIGALNGVAVGGGAGLALACDIRIATEKFKIAPGFKRLGAVSDFGNAYFFPRLVGPAKAIEIYFCKDFIDASEALELGIVNKVVPEEDLYNVAISYARKIAEGPAYAIGLGKELIYRGAELNLETFIQMESIYQVASFTDADFREGKSALREKRKAKFGKYK